MKLLRFNTTERLFHWAFAVPIVLLTASGVMMILTSFAILPPEAKAGLRYFHVRAGFALVILPLVVCLLGDWAVIRKNLREFMNFSADDRRWLVMNFRSLIRREVELPPEGKFNGGQKVNALLMMTLVSLLCASGLTMAALPGALAANIVHVAAFVIFCLLFCGHLYLATLNPSTKPAFMGIIKGYVEADWLRHHHARMYEEKKGAIFDDIVIDFATRDELEMIYDRAYREIVTRRQFRLLRRNSAAILVARKDNSVIAAMQVVGDGVTCGAIVRYLPLTDEAAGEGFKKQCARAAAALLEYPLGCRPVV